MPWAIIEYDYLKYARMTMIFNLQNTISVCVADGMYLIEQAGVIIDWIIACNCLNYTI